MHDWEVNFLLIKIILKLIAHHRSLHIILNLANLAILSYIKKNIHTPYNMPPRRKSSPEIDV